MMTAEAETVSRVNEWTEDRVRELEQLETLLSCLKSLNSSTNFLGNIQQCIDLANGLTARGGINGRPSFIRWLETRASAHSQATSNERFVVTLTDDEFATLSKRDEHLVETLVSRRGNIELIIQRQSGD